MGNVGKILYLFKQKKKSVTQEKKRIPKYHSFNGPLPSRWSLCMMNALVVHGYVVRSVNILILVTDSISSSPARRHASRRRAEHRARRVLTFVKILLGPPARDLCCTLPDCWGRIQDWLLERSARCSQIQATFPQEAEAWRPEHGLTLYFRDTASVQPACQPKGPRGR